MKLKQEILTFTNSEPGECGTWKANKYNINREGIAKLNTRFNWLLRKAKSMKEYKTSYTISKHNLEVKEIR